MGDRLGHHCTSSQRRPEEEVPLQLFWACRVPRPGQPLLEPRATSSPVQGPEAPQSQGPPAHQDLLNGNLVLPKHFSPDSILPRLDKPLESLLSSLL